MEFIVWHKEARLLSPNAVIAQPTEVPELGQIIVDAVSSHWLHHPHAASCNSSWRSGSRASKKLSLHANIATTGRYQNARPTDSSSLYLDS